MTEHAELELAQRYVARTLEPSAVEAFEDHLVGCAECQAEVTLTAAVRRVTREASATPRIPRAWVFASSGLLAAAAIGGFIVLNGIGKGIEALGAVHNPPAYIGVAVRAVPASGDSLFGAAMNAYNARKYIEAARGLDAALRAGVDSVPTRFFLASAQLMAGKNRDAVTNYAHVIAAGLAAAPYLGEAHLFRARALLRLGRTDEALTDLRAITDADADVVGPAKALADSVHRIIGR
jgi:tetratricopeptide (TPR) repeat protein